MCKQERGFSLLELVFGMAIIALMLGLGLSSLRVSKPRGSALALSMEVKGLFSGARAQANATGLPTAVVFPTNGGDSPAVQECAILTGAEQGKVQRSYVFKGNHPSGGIFIGTWSLPSSQSFEAPTPPSEFDPTAWLPASFANHAAYIFLADGSMVTNGQYRVGAEYPLVVASGLNFSAGGSGGGTLTAAQDAKTVLISEDSTVRTIQGVLGGQVGSGGAGPESWGVSALNFPTTPGNTAPVIQEVDLLPAPVDTAFAASTGAESIIQSGKLLTLKVKASDVDGGPLWCRWTANDGGNFSFTEETPMHYSVSEDLWLSDWHWQAPDGAAEDTILGLEVTVRDEHGAVASTASGVVDDPKVLVIPEGKLLFTTQAESGSLVSVSDFDGNDQRTIFGSYFGSDDYDSGFAFPDISIDGRRVAIGSNRGLASAKVMTIDAGEYKELGNPEPYEYMGPGNRYYQNATFSPEGNVIYFRRTDITAWPDGWEYWQFAFQPDGSVVDGPSPYPGEVVDFSPDGLRALVQVDQDIYICDRANPQTLPATPLKVYARALKWTERGIYYGENLDATSGGPQDPNPGYIRDDTYMDLRLIQADGTGDSLVQTEVSLQSCVGGQGELLFFQDEDRNLSQKNLTTGVERIVIERNEIPGGDGSFNFREMTTNW